MKTQVSLNKETVNKRTADKTHPTNVSEQIYEQFTAVTDNKHKNTEQFRIGYSCHDIKPVKKVVKQRPLKRKSVNSQSLDIVKLLLDKIERKK